MLSAPLMHVVTLSMPNAPSHGGSRLLPWGFSSRAFHARCSWTAPRNMASNEIAAPSCQVGTHVYTGRMHAVLPGHTMGACHVVPPGCNMWHCTRHCTCHCTWHYGTVHGTVHVALCMARIQAINPKYGATGLPRMLHGHARHVAMHTMWSCTPCCHARHVVMHAMWSCNRGMLVRQDSSGLLTRLAHAWSPWCPSGHLE